MTSAQPERSTSEVAVEHRSEAMNANYRTESNLAARQSIFGYSTRPSGQASLLDLIHDTATGPLLDVGCGNGLWLDLLGKRGPLPETVIGLDRSRGMLAAASSRLGSTVRLIEGD